jgi:hypothetical protein
MLVRRPRAPRSAALQRRGPRGNETTDGFHRLASTPLRVTMEVDWIRVFRAPAGTR